MSDLADLYQELIIDHSKNPHNFGTLTCAQRQAEGFNPLCGDKITIFLKLENEIITDIKFKGVGCAISTASASLMTDAVKGKTLKQCKQLFKTFHHFIMEGAAHENLGKLEVLGNVREFPMRVKCATLAWHTLSSALNDTHEVITTE